MRFRELFLLAGTDWDESDELFSRLQELTCFMYSSNPGTKDVNELGEVYSASKSCFFFFFFFFFLPSC